MQLLQSYCEVLGQPEHQLGSQGAAVGVIESVQRASDPVVVEQPHFVTGNAKEAISKRHGIYYDTDTGTLASAYYFKDLAEKQGNVKYITLDGKPSVKDVAAELVSKL